MYQNYMNNFLIKKTKNLYKWKHSILSLLYYLMHILWIFDILEAKATAVAILLTMETKNLKKHNWISLHLQVLQFLPTI